MKLPVDQFSLYLYPVLFMGALFFGIYSNIFPNWWFDFCQSIRGASYPATAFLTTLLFPLIPVIALMLLQTAIMEHFSNKDPDLDKDS